MLNKKLSFLILMFLSCTIYAQDETIVTESGTPLEDIYIDGIVNRNLIDETRILEYDHIREADVSWERKVWRIVDVREKMNMSFKSPHKPFFTILREMAENGDIAVFKDEEFRQPMTVEEIEGKLNRIDTVTAFDYDTYEEKIEIVKSEVNWNDIEQYRLKEVWYFDKELSVFKSRILGISPIQNVIDMTTGEFKYALPLFWIYYPEAREPLSRFRVENDFNEISPMSWFDLFEQRFFASYIMKQSNTLDLRIADLYNGYDREGIDRLMESDKIKSELFNFEHDLWEY